MEQYLCLKASAGSGKTFALSVRYISLLLMDINVTSILTLTFTNKAALEMSQRIYETLLNLGEDEAIMQAISKETNLSHDEILHKKEAVLEGFINNELSIYTIDKFINKILREFCGYININDDFSISVDDEDILLYKFLISLDEKQFDLLINFSHNYNKKLNNIISLFKTLDEKNEQYDIKEFDQSVISILKTDILNNAQDIKEYVLKSTLSNSAKKAVDFDDIDSLLDKGKSWLSKDSLGEYSYFKKDKDITQLDDKFVSIKENLSYLYKFTDIKILNELFAIFNNFKKFRLNYKIQKNSFEFSDITNLVHELLSKHIQKDFLYFRLDVRYNHILIDEFQDTSVLQYKILKPLIEELMAGSNSEYKTFFYVGDTKQSIYRFRGGTKELFDWVIKEYEPNLKLQILDKNYRSSLNVVGFVNDTFSNIPNYEYYKQNINSNIQGYVEITSLYTQDDEKFIDIKNKLIQVLNEGLNPNNIAILTYTNKDVLELYEYLDKEFPNIKIITELTSKLINQNNINATINFVKYLYFKEDIYKSNFNALIGKSALEDIELNFYIKDIELLDMLKQIAYKYEFFDENFIKFLQSCEQYTDIVDFVYEVDNNDTSMINEQVLGLQILTVFKSKGLEFDTVFVLDRISKKNPDKSSLLFEYDDIYLKKIYYKDKYRINFDDEYNNAILNEKDLTISDELNILYVALTRAKYNMIIFKKDKQSVFDNLAINLVNMTNGQLYINKKLNLQNKKLINIEYDKLNLGIQEIIKQEKTENATSIKAKFFGIATHYCLEMMNDFDKTSLDYNIKLTKSKYNNYLDDNDFDDIYNRINNLINNKEFKDLINNSYYTKEQSLIYNDEVKVLDLLIIKDNCHIIIDYKTTINKENSHIKQVNLYKRAISTIVQNSDIKSYLVYLGKNNIELVLV